MERAVENQKSLEIPSLVLLFSVILLPISFAPLNIVPLFFVKALVLSLGVAFSALALLVYLMRNKVKLVIPFHPIFIIPIFSLAVFLFSSLFSAHFSLSFSGYGFESGTFIFIFLFWSVFFLSFFFFRDRKKIPQVIFSVLLVCLLLFIYQILLLIPGLEFLGFKTFSQKTSTPVGNWNEIGFFAGLSVIISLVLLETILKNLHGLGSKLAIATLFIGLLFIFLINISIVWLLTTFFVILFLVFYFFKSPVSDKKSATTLVDGVTKERFLSKKSVSKISILALFFIALLFLIGGFVGQNVQTSLGINYLDVKPSWSSTKEVFLHTLRSDFKSFLLGSGPNSFLFQWRQWKPSEVNLTAFWNAEFHNGVGLLPTFAVTTGSLGLLTWMSFLFLFFWLGVKKVWNNKEDWLSVTLFFASGFLWLSAIFYPVGPALFIMTAFFSGLFLTSIFKDEIPKSFCLDLSSSAGRKNKSISLIILSIFAALALATAVLVIQKTLAASNFQKGVLELSSGKIAQSGVLLERSVKISGNDIFRRHLSEFFILEASQMAQEVSNPTDKDVEHFRRLIDSARNNAELSVIYNRKNFENWINLAGFYEFLASFDADNSSEHYENARLSYQSAIVFDRQNPFLDLMLARLNISLGALEEAENYVSSALDKKPNYSEAIFLLSRIKAARGDLDDAIVSVSEAIGFSPQEPSGYFQLGLLNYQNNNFENAKEALNVAISLEPQYANARYFLGLSLAQLGDTAKALEHFRILEQSFPSNEEIKFIISNLQEGNEPFETNSEEFSVAPPEERDGLPIQE
ncbi:MAG: tetratricopeptide repeat protein [Candidatus Paceibacterota bacterium]|nr:MAG: tetratricopeptide repeat protein [Candidatus Paceibacterota bacterium]